MRELLFRGKQKDNNEWVKGALISIQTDLNENDKTYIVDDINFRDSIYDVWKYAYEVEPSTIGQFTGLTDKNGKKIFEGDIVLFEDESPSNYEYHDSTEMRCGEIKFDDGQFYLTNRIAVEMEDLIYYGTIDGEVIGNIHDNPELFGG